MREGGEGAMVELVLGVVGGRVWTRVRCRMLLGFFQWLIPRASQQRAFSFERFWPGPVGRTQRSTLR